MSFTVRDERRFQSTKTSSKEIATKIWKKRDGEIALGLFKIGWPGERMTFAELCDEFRSSHSSTLSVNSQRNHRMFSKHLRQFFGDRNLIEIHRRMVEEYREYRRRQPSQRNPKITVKGATVNRELECLQCMFQFAVTRKYIAESPAAGVRHFDERRERPAKRMLSVEEEQRIFEAAPPSEKPISLSQSARFQQANWQCKEGLADYTQEGRCFVFPDLQSAMYSARD